MTSGTERFDSAAAWARHQAGDVAALERMLEAHLPGLRAFVRLRLGPSLRARESGSDVVQSVCRQILQDLDRFQHPGEGAFRAWLYTTAARTIANRVEHHAAAKRDVARERQDSQLLEAYRTVCTPSAEAVGREALQRIERALDALSDDHREVIVSTRIMGCTRAETAERMGRSEASVRSLLTRALAALAEHLVE